MSRDLRVHARFPCRLPCAMQIGGESFPGVVTNVSAGGFFIESDVMMDEKNRFEVKIDPGEGMPGMTVPVELVHWRHHNPTPDLDSSCGYGVRVLRVSPDFLALVKREGDRPKASSGRV